MTTDHEKLHAMTPEEKLHAMTPEEKLHALSRKMAHQFANVLYLTKDDFFHSDQWQAGMDSLNQYLLALAGPAPTENDNG